MKNNTKILSFIFIATVVYSPLFAETVAFAPAGQDASYDIYNTIVTNANTSAGTGGFTMSASNLTYDLSNVTYQLQASFDGGTSWYSNFSSAVAATGTYLANGMFQPDVTQEAQISVSHEVLSNMSAWPGNDGTLHLRVKNMYTGTYKPNDYASDDWTIDLTRPTISSASIISNNGTNTAYATTGNTLTLGLTGSENLSNTGSYTFTGGMSGLDFLTNTGADATQWTLTATVSTHAEGVVTFSIDYYDANYNQGSTPLTGTTDGSSVTIDKTSPEITVSIASSNDESSLAKHNDVVTLSIGANENLFEPPSVEIATNNSATVNPTTASNTYTATHTMDQSSDPQSAVTFSISGIKDYAGNTVSSISQTSDASSVTFDYTAPQLTTVTTSSDNALSSGTRAKADDVVTVTFYSNEQIQTPVVLIESESAYETNASGDKTSWTATKTMDADDADGAVDFTINFSDLAGNAGTEVDINDLTSGGVTYDNTAPTTNSVTVASSNSNDGYAISGDVISVTIVSNENLQGDEDLSPYGISSASIASRTVTGTDISKISAVNWKLSLELNGNETSGPAPYAFTMTDLTGNQTAVTADLSDITIDNNVPSLTSINIASVNTDNSSYAKANDEIRVTFVANENLSTTTPPTGSIASTAATVSATSGQTNYTSTITTNSNTTEGDVAFTLAFQDPAGNTATANAVTDGSGVIFDRTAPLMSYVRMASNNDNALYAKVGSLVTLTFKATDNLKGTPTVTMFSNAVTSSGSNNDSLWTATATMQANQTDGDVPFTLDFTDLAGNTGTQITQVSNDPDGVVIFDEVLPTLTQVSIASNNSNGATLAKVGDIITLTIVSSENIQTPTATIAGRTGSGAAALSDATSGLSLYESTYEMLDGDTEGTVAFAIDFSDLASNAGTQVTELESDADGSGVTFDKTAPSFTTGSGASISISSDNADNTVAILSNTITLQLTSTEPIKSGSNPVVTINGNNATVTRNTSQSFTATYQMSDSDGSDDIASIPFSVSSYEDLVGNTGATVASTTDGSAVKYDPTAPTLSNVAMVSVNTNNSAYAKEDDVIRLTFESSETINTPTISFLGSTADITLTQPQANSWQVEKTVASGHAETEAEFSITFSDLAGNAGVNSSGGTVVSTLTDGNTLVTVDRTTPSVTTVDIATNNWIDSNEDNIQDADELNPQYATPGNLITLTITTDEAIQEPAVTIGSNVAPTVAEVDGFDKKKWTATHTAGNVETLGQMSFLIDFTDLASNDGVDHNTILNDTDGNYVIYDNTQPVLSNVIFKSNNSIDTLYANKNSVVTITFNSNEQLLTSSVNVFVYDNIDLNNGQAATVTNTDGWDGTSEEWTASYQLSASFDDSEGAGFTLPYTIDFRDLYTVEGDQVTYQTPGVKGGVTFDKTPPDIPQFTYVSDNSNLATRAKTGDVITTTMKGDEPLADLTLTVGGNNVTETAVGGKLDSVWTAEYTMLTGDAEGPVSLVFDYKDYAGNLGTTKNSTTDDAIITFDKTTPTLSTVTIASNNRYDNAKAKVGDEITISIVASENLISTPTVSILGNSATVAQGGSASQWSATYTMQAEDDAGDVTFNIGFSDLAANLGVDVSETTNSSSVTFDKTATDISAISPSLDSGSDSGVSNSDGLTNDVTPTFTITGLTAVGATTDTLILFVNDVRMDSAAVVGNSVSLTSGTLTHSINAYSVTVKSRDLTGNISDASAAIEVTIDTQVPSVGDALDLVVADDTGVLDNDNITTATTPTLLVAGLAPGQLDSVRIYQDVAGLGITDQFLAGYLLATPITDSFTIGTALSEDVYTFSYKIVDAAGNISAMSDDLEVTIDLTPPSTTAVPDLLPDYDTGVSSTDDITNLSEIVLRITGGTLGDSVLVVDTDDSDAILTGEIISAQTDITISNLDDGTYNYATIGKDQAGNSSIKSDIITFVVDATAPDLNGDPAVAIDLTNSSDTGTDNSDDITNDTIPAFSASNLNVTDSVFLYRTVAGQTDELLVRGYASASTVSFSTPADKAFEENNYNIKVKAKDIAGNMSTFSDALPITIDTTAFTIVSAPDLLLEDDSGVSTEDNITNDRTPRLELKQLAASTDFIELFITNSSGATSLSSSGTKFLNVFSDTLLVPSDLTAGTYVFSYRVTDIAGNTSSLSSGTSVVIDYVAPDIPSTPDLAAENDLGVSSTDNLTSAASMAISASGIATGDYAILRQSEDGGGFAIVDTVLVGSDDNNTASFSIQNAENIETQFTYSIQAEDAAGNGSVVSNELDVNVDRLAPVVAGITIDLDEGSDTGFLNDDNVTQDATPSFTLTGLTSTDSVFLYFNATDSVGILADAASGQFSATIENDGIYNMTVKARDYAGNLSVASQGASPLENGYRLDTTAPVPYDPNSELPDSDWPAPDLIADFDSGSDNADDITKTRNPSFLINYLDPFRLYKVVLYAKKGFISTDADSNFVASNSDNITLSIPWVDASDDDIPDEGEGFALDEGNYEITYTVRDSAGNVTGLSNALNVVVDLTPPDDPAIPDLESEDDTGVLSDDNLTKENSLKINLAGVFENDIGTLYQLDPDNIQTVVGSDIISSDGLHFTATGLLNGTYAYYSTATDVAGNTSASSINLAVDVDLESPDVSGIQIDLKNTSDTGEFDDDDISKDSSPVFTVSGLTVTDSVFLYFNGNDSVQIVASAESEEVTGILAVDGTYSVTLKARDYAGNLSSSVQGSDPVDYVLDRVAPTGYDPSDPDNPIEFSAPDLISDSDTGFDESDNITNIQNPIFRISNLNPFETNKVVLYAQKIFTNTAADSGNSIYEQGYLDIGIPWDDVSGDGIPDEGEGFALVEGGHSITYTVRDLAGNITSASPALLVNIDTTSPPALGQPDLLASYDTGESATDNLTNLGAIVLDQTDTIPGYKWILFSAADVDVDGIYDPAIDNVITVIDSQQTPTPWIDLDGNGIKDLGEGGFGNDGLDLDGDGVVDGTRTESISIDVSVDPIYHFYAVHEDTAGNQSINSNVLTVGVDFTQPSCDITYNDPDNLVRAADGSIDATFTFTESINDLDGPPTITILYGDDIEESSFDTTVNLSKQNSDNDLIWTYPIPLNLTEISNYDGLAAITINATDVYGNSVPAVNTTGSSDLRIDNTPAFFTDFVPGDNSFNNDSAMQVISWLLNEPNESDAIDSASVTLNNLDDGNSYAVSLPVTDLIETGVARPPGILPGWGVVGETLESISEGTYEVIFTNFDLAGNTGNDTINFFTYDTTQPTVNISFSRLYAADGDTVVISAVFTEPMQDNLPPYFAMELPGGFNVAEGDMVPTNLPEPYDDFGQDGIDGTGDENGQYDQGETFVDLNGDGVWTEGDLINWKFVYILGSDGEPTSLNGLISNLTISNAHDRANNLLLGPLNILDSDGDGVSGDLLTFDNFDGTATFNYENITNPNLTNVGIGGDNIRITVSTNEPVMTTNPVPTLNLIYNSLDDNIEGNTVTGLNLTENPDANTWVFELLLSDSSQDDGIINFDFLGNDLAENPIEVLDSNQIFAVDNLPPTYYETGLVEIYGGNPVQGYITANTTEIGVMVFIESFGIDSTLQEGGQVEIQYRNKTRGLGPPAGWLQIGTNDPIIENDDEYEFIRPIADLYAVMDTSSSNNDGLQPGDSIYVRARVIDKHANVTAFGTSPYKLVYDPNGPTVGTILSGDFPAFTEGGGTDTLVSIDQVSIDWSPFTEEGNNESGLERYELRIKKKYGLAEGSMELFFGPELGDTLPDTTTYFFQELFLEHDTRYIAEIVAFDSAGNVSTTLSSDTLLRLNSNPVIETISSQNIYEDLAWSDSVQITDLDLNLLQGDSHIYSLSTNIPTDPVEDGIARGGTSYTIALALDAMIQDDFYNGNIITINTGTGGAQVRTILDYEGGTRTAVIDTTGFTTWDNNPNSGTLYEIGRSSVVIDSLSGVLTWTPTQSDLGEYIITVTVTDAYGLDNNQDFTLTLLPVNDSPGLFLSDSVLISGESTGVIVWEEDLETSVVCTLSNYIYDVDHDVALEMNWGVAIYDTSQLDEDFPIGQVIVGPNTPADFRARLTREYLGFDPNNNSARRKLFSNDRIELINSTRTNPLLDVNIEKIDLNGDGNVETVIATFESDSNYHGSNHRVEFIAEDGFGLETRDTIIVNVLPKNDPPTIAALPDTVVNESDSIWLEFASYTTDIDDESLTFTITALTNEDKIRIGDSPPASPFEFVSQGLGDSVLFVPASEWADSTTILVVAADEDTSASAIFTLDITRIERPHISVSVVQNNAFSNYLQVMAIDTLSKATFLSMEVQNQNIPLDTIAAFTYTGDITFESQGTYTIDIYANAVVGDTTVSESFSLAAGKAASQWTGRSYDGQFSVVGNPGSITYDQPFLIADSTLFAESFHDRASYVLGNEGFDFNLPVEIRMVSERDDLAIHRRKNGVTWEELPSLTIESEIVTLSEKSGYFKLGPKTIIVPEQTNIYQNYPNPFNPTTTVMYDIGLLDGLSQNVTISIYNLLGQHVATLIENKDQIGQFKVQWDGYDEFGQQMSSGVYFIQLTTKTGIIKNKKMMLLK